VLDVYKRVACLGGALVCISMQLLMSCMCLLRASCSKFMFISVLLFSRNILDSLRVAVAVPFKKLYGGKSEQCDLTGAV
jgi:hypothetical protein